MKKEKWKQSFHNSGSSKKTEAMMNAIKYEKK